MQDLRERRGSFLLCACCHEVLEGSSEPKRYKEQMKALMVMPRLVSSLERGIPGVRANCLMILVGIIWIGSPRLRVAVPDVEQIADPDAVLGEYDIAVAVALELEWATGWSAQAGPLHGN